jgi:hypothetical protein
VLEGGHIAVPIELLGNVAELNHDADSFQNGGDGAGSSSGAGKRTGPWPALDYVKCFTSKSSRRSVDRTTRQCLEGLARDQPQERS